MNRKIDLDEEYFNPLTGISIGGKKNCDHDYPPESKVSKDDYAYLTCSKCEMKRIYEYWD